jgi:EAL domain-containing protein (putative c-di-GMP-specific phosphodiesterase class I)
VNLSARQCGNVSRVNRLSTLLDAVNDWTGPSRFGLELTERNVLEFSDTMLSTFESLCQRGVPLSFDHFGSGYSSLGRLQQLPLELIKVNKAFVAGLATTPKSVNLLRAVIALSHAMQIRVVAEGIETQQQLEMLHELGCDLGQGFYIAAPLTRDGLNDFLRTH